MAMGGGGGQSGGAVVGGPTPDAAILAGLYGYNAAQQASSAATQQTNSAINFIRDQYNNAFMSLKPYSMEGIQALNELNSYMGLGAYNPGTAPATVDLQSEIAKLDPAAIRNYINQNTILTPAKDSTGQHTILHPTYIGEGSNNPALIKSMQDQWNQAIKQGGTTSQYPGGVTSTYNTVDQAGYLASSIFGQDTGVYNAVQNYLANKNLQQDLPQYQQQMDLYNYAKQLQGQYQPLTPEQVQEKLMNQPGVAFQYNQGLDAIQRAASSKGMLGSGRLLQSLADYGQGMASQQYGATLDRLAGIAGQGQQAASSIAGLNQNLGNTGAGLQASLGDTIANSYLSQGNSLAQAMLAANQQYKIIGGSDGGGGGGLGSALGGAASLMSSFSGLFSDKNLKDVIATPSQEEILANVNQLAIDQWKYKGIEGNHIGPYAQDFQEKFGVGDGKTINIIDALGVLFASVQALSNKIDSLTNKGND